MQYPSPPLEGNNASTQGIKRSHTDKHLRVPNKAARMSTTTTGNGIGPVDQANENIQPKRNNQGQHLPPSQALGGPEVPTIQQIHSQLRSLVTVPGPDYGRTQTNRQPMVPLPTSSNVGQSLLDNDLGLLPTYPSLQASSGVQNMHPGSIDSPCQSGSLQSIPQQSGPQQSGPPTQNVFYTTTSGSMNPIQAPPYVNTTNLGGAIRQSDPNVQSSAQAGSLPLSLLICFRGCMMLAGSHIYPRL
jgi:hypothetical protein